MRPLTLRTATTAFCLALAFAGLPAGNAAAAALPIDPTLFDARGPQLRSFTKPTSASLARTIPNGMGGGTFLARRRKPCAGFSSKTPGERSA